MITSKLLEDLRPAHRKDAASVVRWLALNVGGWSRSEFYEHELDVSAALEELADEMDDAPGYGRVGG